MIEMCYAVAILSILAVMSISSIQGSFARYDIQQDLRRVEEALKDARQVARNRLQCVELNVTATQMELIPYTGCGSPFTGPQTSTIYTFSNAIGLNTVTIPFLPNGGLDQTGSALVQVSANGDLVKTFEIYPKLGYLR